jgi:enoyl-CoA hydratase/carnithine racemase
MTNRRVKVVREDALTIITIDRAEAHNALNAEMQFELQKVFDRFEEDESQWVAIITGAGEKAFCAGLDLKEQAAEGGLTTPPKGFGGLTSRAEMTKPVIAAVNGIAMGGGFEIVLACDIVVCSSQAMFALPEPRVGLAALAGGIQRLPREIGLKRAMGMLLTGRRVSAGEAYELGFVNEIVDGDALVGARRWASEILSCSPMAVRATKDTVLRGLSTSITQAIADQWEYPAMRAMLGSADAVEGPAAFVERRKPVWLGR